MGGGPAGLGVARGYREAGGTGSVLLVGADEHPPYARPPLTKDYLRGESEADSLPLVEDGWYAEHQVELRLGTPATAVDADPTPGQPVRRHGHRLRAAGPGDRLIAEPAAGAGWRPAGPDLRP